MEEKYVVEHLILSEKEHGLYQKCHYCSSVLDNQEAIQFLLRGFLFRLEMMIVARKWIYEKILNQTSPIDPRVFPKWGLYINSFYINLCGVLDNLAYVLVYELHIEGLNKFQVSLFGKILLSKLKDQRIREVLANQSKKHSEWYENLRTIRDPAAHRIPITFASGTIIGAMLGLWGYGVTS